MAVTVASCVAKEQQKKKNPEAKKLPQSISVLQYVTSIWIEIMTLADKSSVKHKAFE